MWRDRDAQLNRIQQTFTETILQVYENRYFQFCYQKQANAGEKKSVWANRLRENYDWREREKSVLSSIGFCLRYRLRLPYSFELAIFTLIYAISNRYHSDRKIGNSKALTVNPWRKKTISLSVCVCAFLLFAHEMLDQYFCKRLLVLACRRFFSLFVSLCHLVIHYRTHIFMYFDQLTENCHSLSMAVAKFSGNGSDFTTLCINSIHIMWHDTCNFGVVSFSSSSCGLGYSSHCLHNRTYLNQFICRKSFYWLLVLRIGDFHFIPFYFFSAISAHQITMTWANDAILRFFFCVARQQHSMFNFWLFCWCCVLGW